MADGKRFERAAGLVFSAIAVIGAFCIVVALSFLSGEQSQKRVIGPAHHAETSKFYAERDCAQTSPAEMFECVYERVESGQQTAQAEQNLTAQQYSTLAAIVAAVTGVASILVSFAGLLFIRNTLDETRRTYNLTKTSSVAELRPWISISIIPDYFSMDPNRIEIGFVLQFRNLGKTVAENVKIHSRSIFIDTDDSRQIDRSFNQWRSQKNKSRAVIIPGDQDESPHRTIQSYSHVKWSVTDDAMFVLVASVRYTDPLDKLEHWTEQSFLIGRASTDIFEQRYLSKHMVGKGLKDITVRRFQSGNTN